MVMVEKDVRTVEELIEALQQFPPHYAVKAYGTRGVAIYRQDGGDDPGICIDAPPEPKGYVYD